MRLTCYCLISFILEIIIFLGLYAIFSEKMIVNHIWNWEEFEIEGNHGEELGVVLEEIGFLE